MLRLAARVDDGAAPRYEWRLPPVLTEAEAGSTVRYRVGILKKGVPLQRAL